MVGSIGYALFQNMGLFAVLCIFLPKWYMGQLIDPAESFALLAMIYFLFDSITSLSLYAMSTLQ